ncbi:GatB/YqeY domain-containing protein [Quadrisphaera sp. INWT6]|uniref:GatB/YqeY domain-containing protein n=1 Tax=Quadrisphaera sp. INWT6 TaxID=2596917 RepID=UPI001892882C|nr:GatB/YqeY domain-containing protein [Quadrisphaera sp. INWT6]MBF5081895.1 GatB/YqeY domain-containing protein [Quadrisphaera sp. INWT6]
MSTTSTTSSGSLADRLRDDLNTALKAQDAVRRDTLRMALTAVKTASVAGTEARELSDEEVLAVLRTEVKKRKEAAEAFAGAGRTGSAERERAEEAVLAAYLPAQVDDAALQAAVAAAVSQAAEGGKTGMGAMGAVMGVLRPQLGSTVDGGRLSAEVRRQLSA